MTDRRDLLISGLAALGGLRPASALPPALQPPDDGTWANVKQFGARGDGFTNDAPAIQRAIAGGASVVYLPAGAYRLDDPLDLSNRGQRPITLLGAGQSQFATAQSATLLGNTGGVVLDTAGSSYLSLRGFRIDVADDLRRPSTVGILMGRTRANPFPQFHRYDDLVVFMRGLRGGERGSLGIYNVACEHWLATQVRCFADLPFALAARNELGVESPYAGTLQPPASMTMCGLHQTTAGSWRHAGYEFWNAQNIRLDQVYAQRLPGNTWGYPLRFNTADIASIAVTGQFEEWLGVADFAAGASAIDIDCMVSAASGPYLRLARNAVLDGSAVRVKQIHGTQQSLVAAGAGAVISGSQLRLFAGQRIDAAQLRLDGCLVQSPSSGDVTVAAGSAFAHLGGQGLRNFAG